MGTFSYISPDGTRYDINDVQGIAAKVLELNPPVPEVDDYAPWWKFDWGSTDD